MVYSEAATVSGKANFTGTAPAPQKLSMGADPSCAALHPQGAVSEEVVVNGNGTLKNVFVYVKDGLTGKTFPAPKDKVVFDQKGCRYEPHVLGIQVNQPFEILNSDSTLHNVHALPTKSKEFNLGMPVKGMKLTKTFTAPEVMVKIKCEVHPWMNAYLGVLDHPYFSVTKDDGSFEIKNLPPGQYTVEAWHEKYSAQTQPVTIAGDGDAATAEFTFKG